MEAMFWLSGYANSENRWRACLVPAAGEPFFVIRALDAAPLRDRTWLSDIVTFHDWDDPIAALAEATVARGFAGATIGPTIIPTACRWQVYPFGVALPRVVSSTLGVLSGSCGWSSPRPRCTAAQSCQYSR